MVGQLTTAVWSVDFFKAFEPVLCDRWAIVDFCSDNFLVTRLPIRDGNFPTDPRPPAPSQLAFTCRIPKY